MDQADHYYQLVLLGRDVFLRQAAPAALVRNRTNATIDHLEADESETMVANISMSGALSGAFTAGAMQVFPLAKKQGAPFADMITLGRTANNDVVVDHVTVSRFHAFFREHNGSWVVCDSGSKNGTKLLGNKLDPRKERPIGSGDALNLGDVETVFYTASDLFDVLSGSGGS